MSTTNKGWMRTWLPLAGVAIAAVPTAIMGLFVYMSATAVPLHPNAQDVTSAIGVAPPGPWTDAVAHARDIVRAHLAERNLPGVSVAVGADGRIVWAEGFGWATLEGRVPVSPDTRFRIGTASTVLTSAAVGLLMEKGQLALDETIQAHVPEFPEGQWPATLRQVMGHVAGVRSDGGDEGPLFAERCDRPVEALQYIDGTMRFEPGTDYRFSNFGWILVSAAVEAAGDEPFPLFMRREVFEPLGMDHTDASAADGPGPDLATSYFPKFAADPRYGPDLMRPIDLSCYAGAGAFLSTPSDLVRFAMGINDGRLLQPATVQLLQAPQRLSSGKETGYGLGWDLETATVAGTPTAVIGHDGDVLGGMVASLSTFPEFGTVVAVTSNISYAGTDALAIRIAEAFAASR